MAALKWKSEAELVSAFRAYSESLGLRFWPETCGFDFVLEAQTDLSLDGTRVHKGDTIGVEAKLHVNLTVLEQALRMDRAASQANIHAILVPRIRRGEQYTIVSRLGLAAFEQQPATAYHTPKPHFICSDAAYVRQVEPRLRIHLPVVHVETPAGVPSPRSVTDWKIKAVRLCLDVDARPDKQITTAEFKQAGVSLSTFSSNGWVGPALDVRGNRLRGLWRLVTSGPALQTRPDVAYPEVAAALKAAVWG